MRALLLIHRYLGIAGGALMLLWCASGFVMMYVPYPRLTEARRLAGLAPVDWASCRADGLALPVSGNAPLRIEMLAGRPVLSGHSTNGAVSLDLQSGAALDRISSEQAAGVARRYVVGDARAQPGPPRLLEADQWTVSGQFAADRPLYRVALADDAGTEAYVSSVTGRLVQLTTARQRLWNWLGAIPHWVYFFELRRHPRQWQGVVIGSSLVGCFLTVTGLCLAFRRWPRRQALAPTLEQTVRRWHHLAGLPFGVFALTWVASGLLSMQPGGLLESRAVRAEQVRGPAPSAAQVSAAIRALSGALAGTSFVSLELAPFDGQPFFIAYSADGQRKRLDANGHSAPLTERDFEAAARRLGSAMPALPVTREDRYLFSHHDEPVELPAYRLTSAGADASYLYLSATTAAVEAQFDGNARALRWLEGLHRVDWFAALRARPIWDVLVLLLLSGVSALCGTGAWLAYRSLFVGKD